MCSASGLPIAVASASSSSRRAMSSLFGRPKAIQLAVLVDRGHRELPIQPDFAARVIKTERSDLVDIFLKETDGRDEITLTRK